LGDFSRTESGDATGFSWQSYSNIQKAVQMMEDGSLDSISNLLGEKHKIRSFYNNIISPGSDLGDITADTHAVAALLLKPLAASDLQVSHNFGSDGSAGSAPAGVSGTYGINADVYREAARQISEETGQQFSAREIQSITWEAIRLMFTDKEKKSGAKILDFTQKVWDDFSEGKLTQQEAQQQILDFQLKQRGSNDIGKPEWASGSGDTFDAGSRNTFE
jgi:hypothetical protein